MTIPWLILDVLLGILLAGLVAPLALAALPHSARGPTVLAIIGVTCVVVMSFVRRAVSGAPGRGQKRE